MEPTTKRFTRQKKQKEKLVFEQKKKKIAGPLTGACRALQSSVRNGHAERASVGRIVQRDSHSVRTRTNLYAARNVRLSIQLGRNSRTSARSPHSVRRARIVVTQHSHRVRGRILSKNRIRKLSRSARNLSLNGNIVSDCSIGSGEQTI